MTCYVHYASGVQQKIMCIDTVQTRKIKKEIKITTAAKISSKFSRESPYISNTFLRKSLKYQTDFHGCKRSPRHSKYLPGNWVNLEIRIFKV